MDQCIEEKFHRTLNLLGHPDCKISDDTYLQLLISKLSKQENNERFLALPVCEEFLKKSLEDKNCSTDVSVKVFSLQILAILLSDENKFLATELKNLIVNAKNYNFKDAKNSSLQLAYVSLLMSFLSHGRGLEYLLQNELWKDVMHIYLKDRSIYIRRESQKFIITLLGAVREDKAISETILRDVFLPMIAKKDVCGSHLAHGEEETNPLALTIDMACAVLEASSTDPLQYLCVFLTGFDIEQFVFHLLDHASETNPNHGLISKLGKLLCLFHFNAIDKKSSPSDLKVFSNKILALLSSLVKKQSVSSVLAVALQCHSCLCKTKNSIEVTFEDETGKKQLLKDQLIYIQVTPLLLVSLPSINKDLNSNFMSHICETTSSATQQLAIQLKDAIKKSNSSVDFAYLALNSILQIKDTLDRESAVVVFRSVAFMLWGFARPHVTESLLLITKSPKLLGAVLDGLRSLIELYHLTWRDSLETLCLMSFIIEIIQNMNSPAQVVVQAFQLMKRCIEDFIPPNLALLTNSLQNSSLSQLGPLLEKRIHDPNWEVKDSVYEVLECISNISECKFPVFQEMLLKNKLCELTVKVGVIDSEPYVRASALSCVAVMVRVTPLWMGGLSALGIPVIAVNILQEESEGLVRKEAASLVTELYGNHRIANTFKPELYKAMFDGATKDLHWEVKIKALHFWRTVAEKKLSDQGMIDGTFPSITFSKVDRKIVTLDPPKVKELIQNVLEELSKLGCLRALLTAITDCDLNVAQCAVSHLSYFRTVSLQNGLIPETIQQNVSGTGSSQDNHVTNSVDSYISLLNSLLSVNEDHAEATGSTTCQEENLYIKPQGFLSFLGTVDLNLAMEQRHQWLEQCGSSDILSLLEDILASQSGRGKCSTSNVNDMDCY